MKTELLKDIILDLVQTYGFVCPVCQKDPEIEFPDEPKLRHINTVSDWRNKGWKFTAKCLRCKSQFIVKLSLPEVCVAQ